MVETVSSPITNSPSKLVTELDAGLITKKYKEELSISIDRYLPANGKISVYQCPDTGYRFYYPFTVGDASFYQQLQNSNKNYYEPWKWENEQAAKYIKLDNSLLDIGCGQGLFLKEMKKKGMQNLYGIDFAANEADKDVKIENTTIEKFSINNAGRFDVITCFQVLEHITNVKSFIEDCMRCLKPDGKLIIAVPNSHPYIYRYDRYHTLNLPPHHAGLWDKDSLKKICNYFPLELLFIAHQPIGAQLDYYVNVQIDHYSKSNILCRYIFSIPLFRKIYAKCLSLFKKNIEGHSIIAVYRKK